MIDLDGCGQTYKEVVSVTEGQKVHSLKMSFSLFKMHNYLYHGIQKDSKSTQTNYTPIKIQVLPDNRIF